MSSTRFYLDHQKKKKFFEINFSKTLFFSISEKKFRFQKLPISVHETICMNYNIYNLQNTLQFVVFLTNKYLEIKKIVTFFSIFKLQWEQVAQVASFSLVWKVLLIPCYKLISILLKFFSNIIYTIIILNYIYN